MRKSLRARGCLPICLPEGMGEGDELDTGQFVEPGGLIRHESRRSTGPLGAGRSTGNDDRTSVTGEESGHQSQQRRLPRAVRPDEADDRTGANEQVYVVEGDGRTESLRDAPDDEWRRL